MVLPLSISCLPRHDTPHPGFGNQGTGEDDPRRTTQQHKTHSTASGEVHYPWHPWFGNRVEVLEFVNRSDRSVARCRREGDESGRALELPRWMLDRTSCCRLHLA